MVGESSAGGAHPLRRAVSLQVAHACQGLCRAVECAGATTMQRRVIYQPIMFRRTQPSSRQHSSAASWRWRATASRRRRSSGRLSSTRPAAAGAASPSTAHRCSSSGGARQSVHKVTHLLLSADLWSFASGMLAGRYASASSLRESSISRPNDGCITVRRTKENKKK